MHHNSSKRIVIFASGTGSNAQAIINHFTDRQDVEVSHVLSNNLDAGVLEMAEQKGVPTYSFTRNELYKSKEVLEFLKSIDPDLLVLAGFMWIIPENIIKAFPNKIINIHPSLLPKYGGKGMFGDHVHRAVLANAEAESGISIHYVNEHYDEGELIAQYKVSIDTGEREETLVEKIKTLEHSNYPKVIDQLLFPKNS